MGFSYFLTYFFFLFQQSLYFNDCMTIYHRYYWNSYKTLFYSLTVHLVQLLPLIQIIYKVQLWSFFINSSTLVSIKISLKNIITCLWKWLEIIQKHNSTCPKYQLYQYHSDFCVIVLPLSFVFSIYNDSPLIISCPDEI